MLEGVRLFGGQERLGASYDQHEPEPDCSASVRAATTLMLGQTPHLSLVASVLHICSAYLFAMVCVLRGVDRAVCDACA